MWILFALISSFSETAKDAIGKSSAQKTNEYITAFALQFFSLIVLIPFVILTGIPPLRPSFWIGLTGAIFSVPTWSILYMKAIKLSPLSVSVPMLAFNPIFTALLSIVFDRKIPSEFGWFGIFLVSSGLYLSRVDSSNRDILSPLKKLAQEPGALAMLGVALIWSIGAHLSKMVVSGSTPLFAAFSMTLLAALVLYTIAKNKTKFTIMLVRNNIKSFASLGIINAVSDFAMNVALTGGITPYVISIKRSNIIWSSLLGKILYHEKISKIKMIGLLIMFIGIIFIILF